MPNFALLHKTRISRGKYQVGLIDMAWALTCGMRSSRGPFPLQSAWIIVSEIAEVLGCSEDQVWDDVHDAKERGILAVEERRGQVRLKVLWHNWAMMPDYKAPVKELKVKKESAPNPDSYRFRRPITFTRGQRADVETSLGVLDVECVNLDDLKLHIGEGVEGRLMVRFEAVEVKGESKEKEDRNKGVKSEIPASTPESSDPSLAESISILRGYGAVDRRSVIVVFRKCRCTSQLFLEAVKSIKPEENAENPVGRVLSQIPAYLDGSYKPVAPKKKVSERDQRAYDALRGIYGRNKIA